ncbi:zinc finger, C2H2 type, partial [Teladorsagia circumcincta]
AGYGGRCSNDSGASGAMSTTSSSSTPTPVRRSRSNHDGMLKCQFCPKKWADQTALHTHMADCRMMRGHECAQCGKRFKARGGLQQHLRIHSNDRPYACHFCAKRFTQKSHVDQHERIHTGQIFCVFLEIAFVSRADQQQQKCMAGLIILSNSPKSEKCGLNRMEDTSLFNNVHKLNPLLESKTVHMPVLWSGVSSAVPTTWSRGDTYQFDEQQRWTDDYTVIQSATFSLHSPIPSSPAVAARVATERVPNAQWSDSRASVSIINFIVILLQ